MANKVHCNARRGEDWFGVGGQVDLASLALLASKRVDSMFLRFKLLSALVGGPISKVDALALLRISRPHLDRILKDWSAVGIVDVQDASVEHFLKPKMTIYLVRRPVITITRLNGQLDRFEDPSALKNVISAIMSKTGRSILAAVGSEGEATTARVLRNRVQQEDIYRHIRILLEARLLLKLRTRGKRHFGCSGVLLRRHYKSIGFLLEPVPYR